MLCRLRLRVRRPSGGCDWPGLLARPSSVGYLALCCVAPGFYESSPGWLGAQGQPGCFCPQAWGQRRMLFLLAAGQMEEPPGKTLSCEEKEKVPGMREGLTQILTPYPRILGLSLLPSTVQGWQ